MQQYDWIAFYTEFAIKLLAFKNDRKTLIQKICAVYDAIGIKLPTLESDNKIVDIDPFTIFGLFNKGITNPNRIAILRGIASEFGVLAKVPSNFDGIPVLDNRKSTFYSFRVERNADDIDNLWELFAAALALADNDTEESRQSFSAVYDKVHEQRCIKWNITMALYWVRPYIFINLDSRNRSFITNVQNMPGEFVDAVAQKLKKAPYAADYLAIRDLCKKVLDVGEYAYKSFPNLSYAAWVLSKEAQPTMINELLLQEILTCYKKDFVQKQWPDEKFKWEAVKYFQDNWDIDAADFGEMLTRSLNKTYNLLASMNSFPAQMIKLFAQQAPEEVRSMFRALFDETQDVVQRILHFKEQADILLEKYDENDIKHYQNENSISTYLWLRYPNKYYIYKFGEVKEVASKLGCNISFKKRKYEDNLKSFYVLYDELCAALQKDEELKSMLKSQLEDTCYPDPELKTLTIDVGFYISRYYDKENEPAGDDWWPSLEAYNPNISKEKWQSLLADEEVFTSSCLEIVKRMLDYGGAATCTQLAAKYGENPQFYSAGSTALAQRVQKKTGCLVFEKENGDIKYWPILYVGKKAEAGDEGSYMWKLRDELREALGTMDISKKAAKKTTDISKNTILYGPPGTGKTYYTTLYAVAIIENKPLSEVKSEPYEEVVLRYNSYKQDGLIEFTTFHQSYGYEEFIEGIRPIMMDNDDNDDDKQGDIGYEIADGLFKSFCTRALVPALQEEEQDLEINKYPAIWKVSLEGTYDNPTRTECLDNGHIRIGWDDYGKEITSATPIKEGKTVLNAFYNKMQVGDIVLSCYSATTIDAIGVVTGDPEWNDEYEAYKRLRKVKWLVKNIREDITGVNDNRNMTLATVYKLKISLADVMAIVRKYSPAKKKAESSGKNYVFIIDEVNRGNISKIFGELITLIEPSKRIGQAEAVSVKLPYSKTSFGVPDNVYLLGTMNTADRSIAMLDTALRRRFQFREMQPDPNVLDGIFVEGVSIKKLLSNMNLKISALFDREHTIGHAYFMKLKQEPSLAVLASIFANNIIPLLQEYFYEDYEKIRLVLGDNKKNNEQEQFIMAKPTKCSELFGENIEMDDVVCYEINQAALDNIDAYKSI